MMALLAMRVVEGAGRTAVAGGSIVAGGLIAPVQDAAHAGRPWIYAWCLVFPTAFGLARGHRS